MTSSTNNDTNKWLVTTEQDPKTGELYLTFPPELLNQAGWDFGDTIVWEDQHNGSFVLKKKSTPSSNA